MFDLQGPYVCCISPKCITLKQNLRNYNPKELTFQNWKIDNWEKNTDWRQRSFQKGGEGIVPTNSQLGAKRRRVVSTTLRPSHHWENAVPIVEEGGWTLETVWRAREVPRPQRFDPRIVHTLASIYGGAHVLKTDI
jgi:hypothetical protein